ncbi:hypothetical protein FACS189428_0150 [Clostridia bacterium]|nr:hypothetical protein FACS189428_0150 [Clostridia bacterium]
MKATESKTNGRYINLLNDWGFKYIFSKKEHLIHFLNEILLDELFKDIEIKRLTPTDMKAYKYSELKYEDFPDFIGYVEVKSREGREEGILVGEKRGEKQGILKEKKRTAKNLLTMGFLVSDISKATGLTPKQIQQLN